MYVCMYMYIYIIIIIITIIIIIYIHISADLYFLMYANTAFVRTYIYNMIY